MATVFLSVCLLLKSMSTVLVSVCLLLRKSLQFWCLSVYFWKICLQFLCPSVYFWKKMSTVFMSVCLLLKNMFTVLVSVCLLLKFSTLYVSLCQWLTVSVANTPTSLGRRKPSKDAGRRPAIQRVSIEYQMEVNRLAVYVCTIVQYIIPIMYFQITM